MGNAGKRVKVDYVGTYDNGEVFDSSKNHDEPLEFVCMQGDTIPGFEKAVESMEVGETKTVHLSVDEAYGPWDPAAVQEVPVSQIPNGDMLPVGKRIIMYTDDGMVPMLVAKIENDMVTFDMNHPMAGKELNFEITLLSVEE